MKKTSNRLHSLFAALAALILAAALAVPAFAIEGGFADLYYRMFDDAEVLTEDEDNELEDALEELSLRQSFDVTIATIESMESVGADSMEQFADDLYDYCQYGYGPDMDGVLLLVSVGDRKWHISTCGYGITAFTDAGIQYLGQQMTPFMADGDYAGAFRTFVQWSDTYIDAARAGHPYDVNNLPREPLSPMYLVLALGIGLVLAWVVVSVMKSQLRSVAFQENAASYVREGVCDFTIYPEGDDWETDTSPWSLEGNWLEIYRDTDEGVFDTAPEDADRMCFLPTDADTEGSQLPFTASYITPYPELNVEEADLFYQEGTPEVPFQTNQEWYATFTGEDGSRYAVTLEDEDTLALKVYLEGQESYLSLVNTVYFARQEAMG